MKALYQRVKEVSGLTSNSLAGYYAEISTAALADPSRLQKVSDALAQIISPQNSASLTQLPQQVQDSISILANDSMIQSASYRPEETTSGPVYNMDIKLTEEGRNRLWQFSRNNVGTQLLLVTNGLPIAAVRVNDELAQTNLTIEHLPDERLVKEAVGIINSSKVGAEK
jgi:preprotein translocase subunit SecD